MTTDYGQLLRSTAQLRASHVRPLAYSLSNTIYDIAMDGGTVNPGRLPGVYDWSPEGSEDTYQLGSEDGLVLVTIDDSSPWTGAGTALWFEPTGESVYPFEVHRAVRVERY